MDFTAMTRTQRDLRFQRPFGFGDFRALVLCQLENLRCPLDAALDGKKLELLQDLLLFLSVRTKSMCQRGLRKLENEAAADRREANEKRNYRLADKD